MGDDKSLEQMKEQAAHIASSKKSIHHPPNQYKHYGRRANLSTVRIMNENHLPLRMGVGDSSFLISCLSTDSALISPSSHFGWILHSSSHFISGFDCIFTCAHLAVELDCFFGLLDLILRYRRCDSIRIFGINTVSASLQSEGGWTVSSESENKLRDPTR